MRADSRNWMWAQALDLLEQAVMKRFVPSQQGAGSR